MCTILFLIYCLFLCSDILASSLEPLEPPKFDASLLADIPFKVLLALLTISGLLNVEQDLRFEKSIRDSQVTAKLPNEQAEDQVNENDSENLQVAFSLTKGMKAAGNNTETFYDNSDGSRQGSSDGLQSAHSQDSVTAIKRSSSDITGILEPLLKVCALKSLTVLLGSNTLLETLTSDVYTKNSLSSKDLSEQRLNCMQLLLRSMVSCAVLPSPLRRVVTLMDLERAQSVLTRIVPSVYFNKNITVDKKDFSEGMFLRQYKEKFSSLIWCLSCNQT